MTVQQAAQEYNNRQSRVSHPAGTFDKAGRWYPSDNEHCDCCDSIRGPSRAYPLSYNRHCRSRAHVANLYGVSAADLRVAIKELT